MREKYYTSSESEQERVLDAIKGGAAGWYQVKRASGLGEDRLGLVFSDLFADRKIRTLSLGGTRVYYLSPPVWSVSSPHKDVSANVA
jgi:hypothetical protein